MGEGLVEVVHECTGHEEIIHHDCFLSHRGITRAEDGGARDMIVRSHPTREDKLCSFTVGQGAVLNRTLGNAGAFIRLEHFAGEEL